MSWKTWPDLFDAMVAGTKHVVLRGVTIGKARAEWVKYRQLDLVKTSRYDLSLAQRENGDCEIKLMCSCCGKSI